MAPRLHLSLRMKLIHTAFSLLLLLGTSALPAAAGTESARSFVQVTILGSNPAKGTLTFLDASGRQRVERATGEALQALSVVRPGDQAILFMASEGGSSVVTKIRRARRAEPVAQTADATVAGTPSDSAVAAPVAGSSVPLRRSWPNPYARGSRPGPDRP
jgi:hypothetical protein